MRMGHAAGRFVAFGAYAWFVRAARGTQTAGAWRMRVGCRPAHTRSRPAAHTVGLRHTAGSRPSALVLGGYMIFDFSTFSTKRWTVAKMGFRKTSPMKMNGTVNSARMPSSTQKSPLYTPNIAARIAFTTCVVGK